MTTKQIINLFFTCFLVSGSRGLLVLISSNEIIYSKEWQFNYFESVTGLAEFVFSYLICPGNYSAACVDSCQLNRTPYSLVQEELHSDIQVNADQKGTDPHQQESGIQHSQYEHV